MSPAVKAVPVVVLLLIVFAIQPSAHALGFNAIAYNAGAAPNAVVSGDFNHDGKIDFAVADSCQNLFCTTVGAVTILLGQGDGTFKGKRKFQAGPYGTSAIYITAGDFNGDGNLDLLTVD